MTTWYTKDQIRRAGQMIKVLRLAATPGMDEVAIKLNCGLTYDEERQAMMWANALAIAARDDKHSLFQNAHELQGML